MKPLQAGVYTYLLHATDSSLRS